MYKHLLIAASILAPSIGHLGAAEPQSEAQGYVASIRSVGDVKSRLYDHLNPECGSGVCVENNAGEVCNLVGALDVRVGGAIASPGQPAQQPEFSISGSDLQLMRRIWRQCKPTSWGYWNRSFLLRVTYSGNQKEVKEVSAALRASRDQGRGSATPRATTDPKNDRALAGCLLKEAERGAYSSLDGGRSTVAMLDVCQTEVSRWIDTCIAGGDTVDSCVTKMAILGQATLKLVGK